VPPRATLLASQSIWCVAAPVGSFTSSMPLPRQLGLGLHPVAAVGEQRRAVGRDHQRSHRAGEPGEPLAPLPVRRQVLRQVRVAGGQQHGVELTRGHLLAQLFYAQPGRGGAGVHRSPQWMLRRAVR